MGHIELLEAETAGIVAHDAANYEAHGQEHDHAGCADCTPDQAAEYVDHVHDAHCGHLTNELASQEVNHVHDAHCGHIHPETAYHLLDHGSHGSNMHDKQASRMDLQPSFEPAIVDAAREAQLSAPTAEVKVTDFLAAASEQPVVKQLPPEKPVAPQAAGNKPKLAKQKPSGRQPVSSPSLAKKQAVTVPPANLVPPKPAPVESVSKAPAPLVPGAEVVPQPPQLSAEQPKDATAEPAAIAEVTRSIPPEIAVVPEVELPNASQQPPVEYDVTMPAIAEALPPELPDALATEAPKQLVLGPVPEDSEVFAATGQPEAAVPGLAVDPIIMPENTVPPAHEAGFMVMDVQTRLIADTVDSRPDQPAQTAEPRRERLNELSQAGQFRNLQQTAMALATDARLWLQQLGNLALRSGQAI